ncbi:GAF domain-containing protein [Flexibacter flexilis DSM 6793]|uniref:GAF domain-containing protein n=1 Tax=Flexibacter flexilis DSM 6793 TaxID=927664 RepID=A0A1I1MRZ4_9BACT|nr:GAF domain-containing protein [Flexibacter flexilis]SFC87935.1 GAF domain-containing protein [Flexibacter flexilis DSM 6793]
MKRIVSLGINKENPAWLNTKIEQSNKLAGLLIFLAVTFSVIIHFYFTPLLYLPVLATLAFAATPLLNYWGNHLLSRSILVLVPFTVISIFNAYYANSFIKPLNGFWAMALAFFAFNFAVFDHRERKILAINSILMGLAMICFGLYEPLFDVNNGIDYEFADSWPFKLLCTSTALIIIAASLFMQQNYVLKSEKENADLLASLSEKQTLMEESEATLKNTLAEVQQAREDEQARTWVANGVAQVTAMTREEQSENLDDRILSFIIKYLNANQGGFYRVEFDDEKQTKPYIALKAVYAYDRKKHFENQRIEPKQGLVGQCYMEKETTRLKQIPQNYVRITSGLGEATPAFLAIVPLIYNREVEGIIEVASFEELSKAQIEFLEKAGESLASFIKSSRTNEQTRRLLVISQQQTEEMRSAEEEMRQNMEELSAIQEEMERKQRSMEHQEMLLEEKSRELSLTLRELEAAKKEIAILRQIAKPMSSVELNAELMSQAVA